mmetsp:Transcript_121512/g.389088  ORF Transcript_121512/g.389088 Transcript_121512/m.389088 type:complete len:290 (-) Transcript_121512:151-1020(-)
MQFTPQQLTGGPRFHHRTKIGNWSEDQELEEIRLKDYLAKKESGQLFVTAKQRQLEEALVPERLSETPDGVLRFGQTVMLLSQQSKGYLSINPYDQVAKDYPAFMLTTSLNDQPAVRNSFIIERCDENDGFDDDVVHYAQLFRVVMAPFGSKLQGPTYMHSEMVTALAAAKFSRHQEVTALAAPSGETKWQFLYPDVRLRLEMEGEPVPAGSPLAVRHVQTGSFLASDEIPYANIFGSEMEVHCFAYQSLNKTQNLVGEKKGDITGDVPLRRQGLPNVWTVRTATHDGE